MNKSPLLRFTPFTSDATPSELDFLGGFGFRDFLFGRIFGEGVHGSTFRTYPKFVLKNAINVDFLGSSE